MLVYTNEQCIKFLPFFMYRLWYNSEKENEMTVVVSTFDLIVIQYCLVEQLELYVQASTFFHLFF